MRNFTIRLINVLAASTLCLFAASTSADVIEQNDDVTIAGLPDDITDEFELVGLTPTENPLSTIDVGDGSVHFEDLDEESLPGIDPDWWHGTSDVYVTSTSSIVVDFHDLFVTAFTFRLGANMDARLWIGTEYTRGDGTTGSLYSDWFGGVGPDSSPMYGVFLDDAGSCGRIDSVEIDPWYFRWGIGDMSIATNDSCVSVPEPGSLGLLGAGLLAMGFVWQTRRRRTSAMA